MVTGIKVGSNVVTGHFPVHRSLNRNHELGRDASTMQPHGNPRLPDSPVRQVRQLFGERRLTASQLDRSQQGIERLRRLGTSLFGRVRSHMDSDYITESVIAVNTRSDIGIGDTLGMARNGETSEFWIRLTKAMRLQSPPLSVRQDDIAKHYGVRQSAVTKWKTGKSKPQPEMMRRMAVELDVALDWLDLGRGDMLPPKSTDQITLLVIEALAVLTPEARVEVLKAAITQQALRLPAVAAQLEQAHKAAERLVKPVTKKTG